MKKINLAVVGATGMVGRTFLKVLEEVNLPAESYTLYASSRSAGSKLPFMGTEYEVIESTSAFSLLKINIKTGRKNQIRVQLSDIGHPIVGDKKYGCKHNIMRRMALHAYLVELTSKGKQYKFETDLPKEFKRMFNV